MELKQHLLALANAHMKQPESICVYRLGAASCGHKTAVIVLHECHCDDPRCKARTATRELNAWCERHLGEGAV